MTDHYAYPSELASFMRSVWPANAAPLPRDLEVLLSLAYQSTLLREEERPVTLRMVVAPPDVFPPSSGPPHGVMRLLFAEPRALPDARELSRLAPAAKYARAMIGVSESGPEGRLAIWGILYTGPRWLDRRQGGRSTPPEIPSSPLVIRAFGPGLLAVAHGDHTVAELRGGVIARPGLDVFDSTWIPARFAPIHAELAALHAQAEEAARGREGEPAWGELAPELTRALSYGMVRRVIATMRNAHHGGALVVLPPACSATRYLHLKYAFAEEEPRRRHRTLVLAAMRALARLAGAEALGRPAGWKDYAGETRDPFPAIEEAFFEMSHLIAGLTDVDGAVVVNQRWEVLGFGAEIVGELPDVTRVAVARDRDATSRTWESTDGVGTRHRSAYRLCAAVHEALAIVVSQDGSVRWIAWHDGEVTCWNHVPADPVDERGG